MRKVIKFIPWALGIFGAAIILGTAGAVDCDTINLMQAMLQMCIGFTLVGAGVALGGCEQ